MKIETKFDYFSKVYAMLDNKVYSFEVEKIEIYISPRAVHVAQRGGRAAGRRNDGNSAPSQRQNRRAEISRWRIYRRVRATALC